MTAIRINDQVKVVSQTCKKTRGKQGIVIDQTTLNKWKVKLTTGETYCYAETSLLLLSRPGTAPPAKEDPQERRPLQHEKQARTDSLSPEIEFMLGMLAYHVVHSKTPCDPTKIAQRLHALITDFKAEQQEDSTSYNWLSNAS